MRTALAAPLTKSQAACAILLANGHNYRDIGERLGTSWHAVKFHVQAAAAKIPGDLPAQMKVVFWMRGATREMLEGAKTNTELDELTTLPTS